MKRAESVQDYIKQFPKETALRLIAMRVLVKKLAPEVQESVSYGMPAYKLNKKPLVYFAGYENHIGFYATPNAHEAFKKELSKYKQGKGSVQFPLNEHLPLTLITRIIKFRVKENSLKK